MSLKLLNCNIFRKSFLQSFRVRLRHLWGTWIHNDYAIIELISINRIISWIFLPLDQSILQQTDSVKDFELIKTNMEISISIQSDPLTLFIFTKLMFIHQRPLCALAFIFREIWMISLVLVNKSFNSLTI